MILFTANVINGFKYMVHAHAIGTQSASGSGIVVITAQTDDGTSVTLEQLISAGINMVVE